MKKILNKKNLNQLSIVYFSITVFFIWWMILGENLSFQPYVWDDLHFFRIYSNEELISTWNGNWDPDNIETPSYRPIATLYYHFLYFIFNENTFLLRIFIFCGVLFLILLTNKLFKLLNFSKSQIIIFTALIIFSKIFTTLVAWFTVSILIFIYIFAIASIMFFFLSIEKNNNFYFIISLIFACCAIFAREELYVLPAMMFLLYFYKFDINIKNIYFSLKKTLVFFFLVFLHMFLRKKFLPNADHLQFIDNKVYFGDTIIGIGGLVKAVKSAFLPMGYFSSQYSDDVQKIFSISWILLIFISIIILLKILDYDKNKLKKKLILILLVIVSSLPHLTIDRSFGIYLPSVFALILVSILVNSLFFNTNSLRQPLNFISKMLSVLIVILGIAGGIYRSDLHIQSMNVFSKSIVEYDALMIYGFKNMNTHVSIPKDRFFIKKKHLQDLNIFDFNWGMKIEHLSPKITRSRYHPLEF